MNLNRETRYDSLIRYYAGEYGVDWRLLKAQIQTESAFNPRAVSPAGAKGLTQFMDPTWGDFEDFKGRPMDVWNPEHAIEAQAWYMGVLFKLFMNDVHALTAYNWGMGNLRNALDKHGDDWREFAPREAVEYTEKILPAWRSIDA